MTQTINHKVNRLYAALTAEERMRLLARFTREQNAARHLVHCPVAADRRDHVVAATRLTRHRYRVTRAIGKDVVRFEFSRIQINEQTFPAPRQAPHRGSRIGDQQNATVHTLAKPHLCRRSLTQRRKDAKAQAG